MPDNDGTTTGGTGTDGGEGREDPKLPKPIIIMAVAVTGASCVYIVDTVCTWVTSM